VIVSLTLHGELMVDLKLLRPYIPYGFARKSTNMTHSHIANTVELHMTLNTVLVPMVDQVKLGSVSLLLMSWGDIVEQVV
ncbi:MAG: hypothetical protein ACKPKO_28290, partial [Candidatus Fonsibacter sp.]